MQSSISLPALRNFIINFSPELPNETYHNKNFFNNSCLESSPSPRMVSTYGSSHGIPFPYILQYRNILNLRENLIHPENSKNVVSAEQNGLIPHSPLDLAPHDLLRHDLISGNIGGQLIALELLKSVCEAAHVGLGMEDILSVLSQAAEILSSCSAVAIAQRIKIYTKKYDQLVSAYVNQASPPCQEIADLFKKEISDELETHRDSADQWKIAAAVRIVASIFTIIGDLKKIPSLAFMGDLGLLGTGYYLVQAENNEARASRQDSKEKEIILQKCAELKKKFHPDAPVIFTNIIQMIENQQNPNDSLLKSWIFRLCSAGTAAESLMSVVHALGLFFAQQQKENFDLKTNQTIYSHPNENPIYTSCNYVTFFCVLLGLTVSAVHLVKNYRPSLCSKKEKNFLSTLQGNGTNESEQFFNKIKKNLKPHLENNNIDQENITTDENGESYYDVIEENINTMFGDFFPPNELKEDIVNFDGEKIYSLQDVLFTERTISQAAELHAAFNAADELSKMNPEFALGILSYSINENFRGNRDLVITFLKHFEFTEEEIEKFSRAANTDLGRHLLSAILARRLKITTVL